METAREAIQQFPSGFAFLADELRRNTSSVARSFAEGYYYDSKRQQRRYFGYSIQSARAPSERRHRRWRPRRPEHSSEARGAGKHRRASTPRVRFAPATRTRSRVAKPSRSISSGYSRSGHFRSQRPETVISRAGFRIQEFRTQDSRHLRFAAIASDLTVIRAWSTPTRFLTHDLTSKEVSLTLHEWQIPRSPPSDRQRCPSSCARS